MADSKNKTKVVGKVGVVNIKYSNDSKKRNDRKFFVTHKGKTIFSANNLYRVINFLIKKTGKSKLSEKQFKQLEVVAKKHNQTLNNIK